MYNLIDLQTLFSTRTTSEHLIHELKEAGVEFVNHTTHLTVRDASIITYIGNKIIHIKLNTEPKLLSVDNIKDYITTQYGRLNESI